ncbi:MAG TPA: glycosyltransferase family 9 protein [Puia sp.]|nr:glycosyltransferase family 9 protein [Puia sp.]
MHATQPTFIISRSDSIGDVVLTLPVAGVLRSLFPSSRILFLGRSYTREVIQASEHIDAFLNWDEWQSLPEEDKARQLAATGADTIIHVLPNPDIARAAKRAGIRTRIGTTNRLYHWFTCNTLVRLSRRNSPWHEAQLNLRLLTPLGAKKLYAIEEIGQYYGLTKFPPLPPSISGQYDPGRFNLILHPKSRGHGREWGLENFIRLVSLLPADRFKIFVTGTSEEGRQLRPLLESNSHLTDMTGRLTLPEFISFIAGADGLVASGTGPLHLAAALGIHALGMFPPIRPIHPGRWAPIGPHARTFVIEKECQACRVTKDCSCIREILPVSVKDYLLSVL